MVCTLNRWFSGYVLPNRILEDGNDYTNVSFHVYKGNKELVVRLAVVANGYLQWIKLKSVKSHSMIDDQALSYTWY